MRHALLLLALFAAISSLFVLTVGAQTPIVDLSNLYCVFTPNTNTSFNTCIGYGIGVGVLALLVSFGIVAVAYMIGEVFGVSGLKGWYRNEFNETIKSVMLLVIIFTAILICGTIAAALTGSGPVTNQATAAVGLSSMYQSVNDNYLTPQANVMANSFGSTEGFVDGLGLINSTQAWYWFPAIHIPLGVTGLEIVAGGGANFKGLTNEVLGDVSGGILTSITSPSVLSTIINLIIIPMNSVFLVLAGMFPAIVMLGFGIMIPAGILLRCIPLLRNLGGTLIGIGIGAAIIFPMVLLIFNLPITNYIGGVVSPDTTVLNPTTACAGAGVVCNYLASALNTGINAASNSFLIGLLGALIGGGVYPALNFVTYTMFDPILQFVLILFDIFIVFTVSNNIAALLGGKITLGIGKFKLA